MEKSSRLPLSRKFQKFHLGTGTWSATACRLLPIVLALATGVTAGSTSAMADPVPSRRTELPLNIRDGLWKAEGAAAKQRIGAVKNWGYWLSSYDVEDIAAAAHDLMVIDNGISANRRFIRGRLPEEVARMKRRPDGSSRLLLAYLSFGEAERYRAYWRPEWYDPMRKPVWLGDANPNWDGNYAVQYWHPEWQALIFGTPESYLDVIMAQGFDGVYLDRADAFFHWEKSRSSARADMAMYLRRLSDYARKKNPDFLIIMQNAEELLDNAQVLNAIDGIAKEDLLYGVDHPEAPNRPEDVRYSVQQLRIAQNAGRKVLVVEYLSDPGKMAAAAKLILEARFVPYFAPRLLNCLNPPAVLDASGSLPAHPCR